jgi:hypothetical protein
MKTKGIDGVLIETHNWGSTVAFWRDLGYELEFETDHHSGRVRHADNGPYIFVAERPNDHPIQAVLGLAVADAAQFTPPHNGAVVRPFEKQHWPALQCCLPIPMADSSLWKRRCRQQRSGRQRNRGKNVRQTATT